MGTIADVHAARIYDHRTDAVDSRTLRVLVDRLWPRGISKADAALDIWAKDVTPSSELRTHWHEDPEGRSAAHFAAFSEAYAAELTQEPARAALAQLAEAIRNSPRTLLLTAVKDLEMSHMPTLLAALSAQLEAPQTPSSSE